jgi:hypothetical protein
METFKYEFVQIGNLLKLKISQKLKKCLDLKFVEFENCSDLKIVWICELFKLKIFKREKEKQKKERERKPKKP